MHEQANAAFGGIVKGYKVDSRLKSNRCKTPFPNLRCSNTATNAQRTVVDFNASTRCAETGRSVDSDDYGSCCCTNKVAKPVSCYLRRLIRPM